MLRKVDSSLYRGETGKTIRIAAIAQNNNGVESATFRYPNTLSGLMVQGHPGCEMKVKALTTTFGTTVLFSNTPGARYDLFQEDEGGQLVPLEFAIEPDFGSSAQFQVESAAVRAPASAPARKTAKKAAKKKARKTARKRTGTAKKKATKKKAARKKAGQKAKRVKKAKKR